MKITVQSIGLTPHEPLESHIEKKVSKLDTFYDKIQDCKIFLKVENPVPVKPDTDSKNALIKVI